MDGARHTCETCETINRDMQKEDETKGLQRVRIDLFVTIDSRLFSQGAECVAIPVLLWHTAGLVYRNESPDMI